MLKVTLFCGVLISLSIHQTRAFIENKKHGGHNLFHGLNEEPVKGRVQMQKLETQNEQESSHIHGEHNDEIVEKLGMSYGSGNKNNIFSKFEEGIKKSSIYLQPEPRGLQYMMNTGDYNPFLVHYIGKRSLYKGFVGEPYNKSNKKCDGLHLFCVLRKRRQTSLEPGNVIPGSRGQSVLRGGPHGQVSDGSFSTNIHISVPHGSLGHRRQEGSIQY